MNLLQRVILVVGLTGILHSSMVPPVQQPEQSVCRYHAFTERSLPFTRTYDVLQGDLTALSSEYALIISATGILFLLAGLRRKNECKNG